MPDSVSSFDPRPSVGAMLAEAIERRYEALREEEIGRFRRELVAEGIEPPAEDELREHVQAWSWTFVDIARGECALEETAPVLRRIAPALRPYLDLLIEAELPKLVLHAAAPLVVVLYDGRLAATGIPEPEGQHGWRRETIPQGFFEVGRYKIYRNGSRLAALSRDGEETPAFNAVLLAEPVAATSADRGVDERRPFDGDTKRRVHDAAASLLAAGRIPPGRGSSRALVARLQEDPRFNDYPADTLRKYAAPALAEWKAQAANPD